MAAAARAAPPDARLIADGPVAAAALLPIARRRAVVYLAHNLESGGFRGENERAGLERFERIVLRTFSEAWMATRADEWGARALAGERIATRYVPNVVDTDRIEPVTPAGTGCMLFVADFTYPPNVEAFRFLTERVMPAVWERQPALRLLAVGRGLSGRSPDPRIITPGFVDDLTRAYRDADVALVPLLRGGGSPLKFIEALAYGLPVVASAHAAALLEDGAPGRDFLVADGVEEFAAAIDGLLADPARRAQLGAAGRELAVRSHSIAALATLLAS
jgi:glycosyltransferase involved in cell wall biosynthesis